MLRQRKHISTAAYRWHVHVIPGGVGDTVITKTLKNRGSMAHLIVQIQTTNKQLINCGVNYLFST